MGHPKVSDWHRHEEMLISGTSGFDHMDAIPRLLPKEYPWLKDFEFGFCAEHDLAQWRSLGWQFLECSHFDVESFNQAIATPFGLTDDAGRVRFKDNYVMIMPKTLKEKKDDLSAKEADRLFRAQVEGQAYVSPLDPRGQEFLDKGAVSSDYQGKTVIPLEAKTAKRRGRPPTKG